VRTDRALGRRAGGGLDGRVRLAGRLGRRYRVTVVAEDIVHRRTVTLRRLPRSERRGAALGC
jgi:hypothetical protein